MKKSNITVFDEDTDPSDFSVGLDFSEASHNQDPFISEPQEEESDEDIIVIKKTKSSKSAIPKETKELKSSAIEKTPLAPAKFSQIKAPLLPNQESEQINNDRDGYEPVQNSPFWRKKSSGDYVLFSTKKRDKPKHFTLPAKLHDYLKGYQREGVAWLWKMHESDDKSGGILGDDMGLGKTVQIVAFTLGLFLSGNIARILVVMPVSVLEGWKSEFGKWNEKYRLKCYYQNSSRDKDLATIINKGGICVTTYGLVTTSAEKFDSGEKPFRLLSCTGTSLPTPIYLLN
eukprot:TRINITY_DN17082_c0_g1_i1.p1 TRINITY_DN17082_c0_g1~~TRINITY_DN17082_c0_g1_i1.p1  ORF type:complete len:287 (-),score=54.09 TRINITY_DN17082_c0_g1_i1:90-950(-)